MEKWVRNTRKDRKKKKNERKLVEKERKGKMDDEVRKRDEKKLCDHKIFDNVAVVRYIFQPKRRFFYHEHRIRGRNTDYFSRINYIRNKT